MNTELQQAQLLREIVSHVEPFADAEQAERNILERLATVAKPNTPQAIAFLRRLLTSTMAHVNGKIRVPIAEDH